jgi:hypothetical protein
MTAIRDPAFERIADMDRQNSVIRRLGRCDIFGSMAVSQHNHRESRQW